MSKLAIDLDSLAVILGLMMNTVDRVPYFFVHAIYMALDEEKDYNKIIVFYQTLYRLNPKLITRYFTTAPIKNKPKSDKAEENYLVDMEEVFALLDTRIDSDPQ